FTRDATPFGYHLTREGGHSQRRVVHAADLTGMEVERTLLGAAAAAGVQFFEDHHAIELILASKLGASSERVVGAYALDTRSGHVHSFVAKAVVLATGGAGKVYLYTTNPDVATGDGLAMAHRAGAAVANLEFIQFHPTCLYHPEAKNFLISEALRGEGGILRNKAGEAFMERYDPRKELAPRDVVARSIDSELKRRGDDSAFLDMTHLGKAFLVEHFPRIYTTCLAFGFDRAVPPDEGVIVKQNWDEIRHLMWNYVGIVRTDKRLARAQRRLHNLAGEIQEYYWGYLVDRDMLELRNLAEVARLIVACAQQRKE